MRLTEEARRRLMGALGVSYAEVLEAEAEIDDKHLLLSPDENNVFHGYYSIRFEIMDIRHGGPTCIMLPLSDFED